MGFLVKLPSDMKEQMRMDRYLKYFLRVGELSIPTDKKLGNGDRRPALLRQDHLTKQNTRTKSMQSGGRDTYACYTVGILPGSVGRGATKQRHSRS